MGKGSGKREFPRVGKLLKTERFSRSECTRTTFDFPPSPPVSASVRETFRSRVLFSF